MIILLTYNDIRAALDLQHELPINPTWSAAPDFLQLISQYCIANKPATIVECSSGVSTLVLARCCQINHYGQVWSLENGEEYADKTARELAEFQIEDYATVLYSPLETVTLNDMDYLWYSVAELPNTPIDMLVIDGPPGFIQKYSRYPALPILFQRLSDKAVVYLDDAAREEERKIVAFWQEQFPQLKHEYIATERGCAVLTKC